MLSSTVLLLLLLDFGRAEEIFNFLQGKSLMQTSPSFEMMRQIKTSNSRRYCAMLCHHASPCLAAFFDGELNLCRLFSNINGTTNGGEGDFLMVKNEFGVCELIFLIYCIDDS